jgi:hypothetical protein
LLEVAQRVANLGGLFVVFAADSLVESGLEFLSFAQRAFGQKLFVPHFQRLHFPA